MTRNFAFSVVLLSIAYALLIALITPYANYLIKMPEWWSANVGHGNAQALIWLHLVSALFVLACALPISVIITHVFSNEWLKAALGTGVLATTFILLLMFQFMLSESVTVSVQSRLHVFSSLVDIATYALFPVVVCALIQKFSPPNKFLVSQGDH